MDESTIAAQSFLPPTLLAGPGDARAFPAM
jgi:hypothetical protein